MVSSGTPEIWLSEGTGLVVYFVAGVARLARMPSGVSSTYQIALHVANQGNRPSDSEATQTQHVQDHLH